MKRILTILPILLILLLTCTTVQAGNSNPFFFIQLADTQFGMTHGNNDLSPEIENFTKAVDHINRLKPAFVLISGDLINIPHDIKQTRAFWNVAGKISPEIPLYLLPGNHDIGQPTKESINSYQKLFGKDHYSFNYNGSSFVILNSGLFWDPIADSDLRQSQRKWFEETLAAARVDNADHIFVCTHQPWFLTNPDEADTYDVIPKAQRTDYMELMRKSGVDYALAGHFHRESIARDSKMEMITSPSIGKALGKDPVGLRIFKVYKDHVEHAYYPLEQVPQQVKI